MARGIDFGKLPELASRLHLSFRSGHISLEGQRMVLLHTSALASLRRELVETLGMHRARGVLTRMGYASGQHDADMVRRMMPDACDNDLMSLGPQLHSLEGIVDVTPIRFEIDVAAGQFYGEFAWDNSHEAEGHLEQFGLHFDPVCWTQIGYASGYTSAVMRKPVLYREVQCRGRGDERCMIVGKLVSEWGDEVAEELRYFEPQRVADQIVELQNQVEHLRYSIDEKMESVDLVGGSPAFRETTAMIEKAASSDVTVLLLGETGVGKELFARAIHRTSRRAERDFVAVNCAAMPEELIESELFGAEKGAFTGAQQSRPGRFERAHGGTLFLDEVGELSPAAQAKLLRVLQEGEFERVGDTRTRKVNVRVIAATNVDLAEAARAGRFRADLYYRLNIFPVLIPPLRERREDIPLLVERFLDKYNARHGKRVPGLTGDALAALTRYDWPGNVRELENMIERGVIIVPSGEYIGREQLFPRMSFGAAVPPEPAADPGDAAPAGAGGLDGVVDRALEERVPLEELEERLIQAAMERCNGNLSAAARQLGISRAKLAYRLQKRRG
ncbi:MAG: sigma 54-interacting transcriptional regulator [Ectothiorhodospiraceae bacterium]|nr:sigma 54-interacting transcriptional regulator [Ectothiorhodospiraceae bacterium]